MLRSHHYHPLHSKVTLFTVIALFFVSTTYVVAAQCQSEGRDVRISEYKVHEHGRPCATAVL